jgi:hypothetical protein
MMVYMQAWCREDDANAVQLIVGNNTGVCFGTGCLDSSKRSQVTPATA